MKPYSTHDCMKLQMKTLNGKDVSQEAILLNQQLGYQNEFDNEECADEFAIILAENIKLQDNLDLLSNTLDKENFKRICEIIDQCIRKITWAFKQKHANLFTMQRVTKLEPFSLFYTVVNFDDEFSEWKNSALRVVNDLIEYTQAQNLPMMYERIMDLNIVTTNLFAFKRAKE